MRRTFGLFAALFLGLAVIAAAPVAEAKGGKENKPAAGKVTKPPKGKENKPVNLKLELTPTADYATVEGKAFWFKSAKEQRFRVQLEGLPTPTLALEVFVDGTKVGTMKIEGDEARLDLRPKKGATLPSVITSITTDTDTDVEVKTTTGVLVASGTF